MDVRRWGAVATIAAVASITSVALGAAQDRRKPPAGLLRSEVSLAGHTVAVTFAPALDANDPVHKRLLSADGSATGRAHIAQLFIGGGTLRVGTLDLPKADPPGRRYVLWLAADGNRWTVQLASDASPSAIAGEVPLARHAAALPSPKLIAAVTPTAADSGHLHVRWGSFEALTEIKFVDPPARALRVNSENGLPNVGVKRGNFDDTSAHSREQFLAQNVETALELPNGRRLSASFIRSGSAERPQPERGPRIPRGLPVSGPDYARIASLGDGAVLELTESWVPRLKTDAPLRFGNVTVRIENQVGGFAGVYGLWLKRSGSGWRLVLSNEYDVWGTQHDSKFDVAEIDLAHAEHEPASQPFSIALIPAAADRGRLAIVWGAHEWTADFAVARQSSR